jgi:hypothetical protein
LFERAIGVYRSQSGALIDGVVAFLAVVVALVVGDAAVATVPIAIVPENRRDVSLCKRIIN